MRRIGILFAVAALFGCDDDDDPRVEPDAAVQVAEGIYATPGEPVGFASPEQRATFDRGEQVATRRFSPDDGLGPLFNVTFCAACHEKPVFGGSAGHYRNFMIVGEELDDGTFLFSTDHGGVVTAYGTEADVMRPTYGSPDIFGYRNAIPFFGVGLVAELSDEAILANADPEDADGDGVSGRPNYSEGFIGRFGRKSQTASIEGFIRGPLNNHLGVTTDPLTDEQRARLPVPSNADGEASPVFGENEAGLGVVRQAQAAAPGTPLTDLDDVPDPEMTGEQLFDLVSWAMLLAVPPPDPPSEQTTRGELRFHEVGCAACHVPSLQGPRGLLPMYSDLLLHDMGPELADGLQMELATGSEFRTQPLWGVTMVGPYLHDGRADSLDDAIRWHGGEAEASREGYEALDDAARADLIAFIESLGGRQFRSDGLLPPDAPIPPPGELGGPARPLDEAETERFERGRRLYDFDFGLSRGLGPRFNGDACRACHFDPVIGGAGPIDVNVIRHGLWDGEGFAAPEYGTILPKFTLFDEPRVEQTPAHNVFEPRQTPTTLGLGLIEAIPADEILSRADPDDEDGDGIRGVAHVLPDGRLGRFGWKAQVPTVREFVRDAMSAELGITVPDEDGHSFGAPTDADMAADPELSSAQIDDLTFFISMLAPPPPKGFDARGREVFDEVGCGDCHVPALPGPNGAPVPLYSDLLLHAVGAPDAPGVPDGVAGGEHFRTPPLWGISDTGPYLHDGSATTVAAAVLAHQGEAEASRAAFEALSEADRTALLSFLEQL